MSLKPPAMEKDTAEATDQPPGIHTIFSVSPRALPIWARIPVTRTRPQDMAATYDKPMNLGKATVSTNRTLGSKFGGSTRTHKYSHKSGCRHFFSRVIFLYSGGSFIW